MNRSATIVLCLLALLGCSSGSGGSAEDTERVPVPHVTPPFSGLPAIDARFWEKMWRDAPGVSQRRCVDVDNHASVRSGEFVVGNFSAFKDGWDGTEKTSKLAYTPLYPENDVVLEVTATRFEPRPPNVITLHLGTINAWAMNGVPFYASGTVLPERGHWRLEAVAGRNRGCFELQL